MRKSPGKEAQAKFVVMQIDARHWPWLVKHAEGLGYFGPVDYLHGIMNTALDQEMDWNGEAFPRECAHSSSAPSDLDDGIPF